MAETVREIIKEADRMHAIARIAESAVHSIDHKYGSIDLFGVNLYTQYEDHDVIISAIREALEKVRVDYEQRANEVESKIRVVE